MTNWFTIKVKYTKQMESGELKRVSEPYLVAAMTFTDAEARIYEELGPYIKGEFIVSGIARTDLHDIFQYDDSDTWFKVKMNYKAEGGEDGKEKKITQNFLVSANTVKDAFDRIQESLSGYLVDFEIPSILSSPIVEIFPPKEDLDREISRTPIEEVIVEKPVVGKVYSAAGSDEDEDDEIDSESEIEDNFSEED
ncbi:MAG: DUF4494 domain-containing protein [Bacteroidota bacterium]